ncbi:hypothetical protein LTR50_005524 [Elasticomyces elasticus]|nr:hypothetical protein LTR50_005524 [Elasticomyces elasticus]
MDQQNTNGAYAGDTANRSHIAARERPFKILIAGAGIGGLTAAIALRQQGHEVILFEQSRFANETGAAIHLAPNCNGILRRLGLFAEDIGGNLMLGFDEYTPDGKLRVSADLGGQQSDMWQHPWHLVHRVHLHNALKEMATCTSGVGKPAQLNLKSRITKVDSQNATVTLESGQVFSGDVVVGADGVHSKTRESIVHGDIKPYPSGKSAYRFLIPKEKLQSDPATREYVEKKGVLVMWIADDRRLVMYPCANNTLMNFVAIHPASETDAAGDNWNEGGNKDKLREVYKNFHPSIDTLLSYVDEKELKLWKLLDMDILPTWIDERLVLLGDAAHPFLPHQGQGGGQAIEDAASLAVMLSKDTPAAEIPERIKLYQKCRYERANKIQHFTRLAGRDAAEVKENESLNMMEYVSYNFGHDEWHYSTQMLRKWQWSRTPALRWRMPLSFGPMPGPRQDFLGRSRSGAHSTFTTASITFETSRTLLQTLLPTPAFSFASPGTIATASFSATMLGKMDWLGGGGYNLLGLNLHGVQYTKKDGSRITGTFLAVLFENLTDPIVTGREELGMPKLYCALDVFRRKESTFINASWKGASFGEWEWEGLEPVDIPPTNGESGSGKLSGGATTSFSPNGFEDQGILAYRYVPAVGREGKADAEYAVFVPRNKASEAPRVRTTFRAKKASFRFNKRNWDELPTLHHIAAGLAELPIYKVLEGKIVEGEGVEDVGQTERIE